MKMPKTDIAFGEIFARIITPANAFAQPRPRVFKGLRSLALPASSDAITRPPLSAHHRATCPPLPPAQQDIERSPDVDVSGVGTIRGYRYRDAGRGVNLDAGQDNRPDDGNNFATAFPAPSLRAASWDLDLERRIGAAIGDETVASKNNMLLAPCMNIVRHPYWGRTQETYGEDTYHVGRMATAFTVGLQEYVVGCAKHYAANNIEKGRSTQNAVLTEQTLREIYGRHFEMIVQDGGMGCIMAAYNLVNGIKSTQSEHLIRDILKGPVEDGGFGFEGLVLTDWWAMPGDQNVPDATTAQNVTIEAVNAGTDIEVPWTLHYTEETLANADPQLVEDGARRVLTQKYRFGSALDSDPWGLKPAMVAVLPSSHALRRT
jgi:beta-glucosidase-like glycosyl hydrolase